MESLRKSESLESLKKSLESVSNVLESLLNGLRWLTRHLRGCSEEVCWGEPGWLVQAPLRSTTEKLLKLREAFKKLSGTFLKL